MALTQAEWFEKLKSFVPSWFFETERYQYARFQALAKVLSTVQTDMEEMQRETFISQATTPYLELHGSERRVVRLTDEAAPVYALRVRQIVNASYKAAIKDIVDAILLIGTCEIREGMSGENIFLNRGSYLNRDEFYNDFHYNVFTIIIDAQIHGPYSHYSRGNYLNRLDYIGSSQSSTTVYDSIIAAVDKAKALGVLYKIVERD